MAKVECCYDYIPSYMTGRSHSFAHIILPLSDMLYLRINETEYWLHQGNIAVVTPDTFHRLICTNKVLWFNIPSHIVKKNDAAFFAQNPIFDITENLRPLIALLHHEASEDPGSDALRYLFFYLYAKLTSRSKPKSVLYIESHYTERVEIATLAALENYNPTYYIGWFKKETGLTPNDYLNDLRIEKAKELLVNTQYRMIDIALQTGFANGSSFARAFKKRQGTTPREYRRNNQDAGAFSKLPYWPKL